MLAHLTATQLLTTKINKADDHGDCFSVELGAVVAPNFLVALGYTSAPNQVAYDAFGVFLRMA